MLADTADSHQLPGKVDEPASKAKAYLTHEKRQKRLAKNRVTARISRERKRAFLQQLQQRLHSLELENTGMKQAISQRDKQLVQLRGLSSAHPQVKFDGVNKGLPPCPEKNGLHGTTICIVPPDAALKSHVNIVQPPSSNHGSVEEPKVGTQKNSSHCSTAHESLATQVALPDASSAAFCSIDYNEDLADFLASFLPDSQGLLTNAKGASTNIDPTTTEQLETRQDVTDWNEAISTRSGQEEHKPFSSAHQGTKEYLGTPGTGRQDVPSVDVSWFSAAATWTSMSSSTHIDNFLQATSRCLSEEGTNLYCSRSMRCTHKVSSEM